MASQQTRTRRGLIRALVVVALLAGVFTMHSLTGNHDAAMAMTSQTPSMAAVHSTGMMQAGVADMAIPAPSAVIVEPSDQGHLHSMGDVCLAMLAALLLMLIVALARRSLAVAHPVVLAPAWVAVTADDSSPPWRRPTLSKLCILRI